MKEKIFLGRTKESFEKLPDTRLFISKHSWDCDWYWGFGYIGNGGLHTHFDSVFLQDSAYEVSEIFLKTKISQDDWWTLRDLFFQAYALKECAGVYRYGGHQTSNAITTIIKNSEMNKRINEDLEMVLDEIWGVLSKEGKVIYYD